MLLATQLAHKPKEVIEAKMKELRLDWEEERNRWPDDFDFRWLFIFILIPEDIKSNSNKVQLIINKPKVFIKTLLNK